MKLKVDHVERPELPWRTPEQAFTECGLVAASHPTITRAELADRYKQWGQQRTAMMVCMTCFATAQNWGTWNEDPLHSIERARKQEPRRYHHRRLDSHQVAAPSPLRTELRAMALLIERHREEFDGLVAGLSQVASLDAQREKRRVDAIRRRGTRIIHD
jgi:hypothetical protein